MPLWTPPPSHPPISLTSMGGNASTANTYLADAACLRVKWYNRPHPRLT